MINISAIIAAVIGIILGLTLKSLKLPAQFGMSVLLPLCFVLKPEVILFMLIAVLLAALPSAKRRWYRLTEGANKGFCTQSLMTFLISLRLINYNPEKTKIRLTSFFYLVCILPVIICLIFITQRPVIDKAQYLALSVFCITAIICREAYSISSELSNKRYPRFLSLTLSIMSGVCGLLIPTIGIDVGTGAQRYSMGIIELYGGIDFIIVAMGICCIGEILYAVSESSNKQTAKNNTIVIPRIEHELQRFLEMLVLVFVIFFGIPCSQVMAIIVGAIESYGIAFFQIWETITDMSMTIPAFISICFLIPLLSKKLLTITKRINMKINGIYKETFSPVALHPIFVIAAFVGAYSLNYRLFDMFLLVAFGILGCAMKQLSFPTTPLIICAAFGPRLEEAYRAPFSWSPLTALFYFLSVVTLIIYIKKACERQQ